MKRSAVFAASILLLLRAAAESGAEPDKEIPASEFMERFSSMLNSVPTPPAVTEAEVIEIEDSDPETYIFISRAKLHPPKPVDLGGDGRLTLNRPDRGEQIIARYRGRNGSYNRKELRKIDRIMRCSLTAKETPVSIKLVEILDAIEDHFGKGGITLLSGYRTPTLNSRTPGAARRSLPMLGWAADIRIPGHSPATVAAYARKLRAGGIGYYPDISFTHLDAGRARYWMIRRSAAAEKTGPPAIPQNSPRN